MEKNFSPVAVRDSLYHIFEPDGKPSLRDVQRVIRGGKHANVDHVRVFPMKSLSILCSSRRSFPHIFHCVGEKTNKQAQMNGAGDSILRIPKDEVEEAYALAGILPDPRSTLPKLAGSTPSQASWKTCKHLAGLLHPKTKERVNARLAAQSKGSGKANYRWKQQSNTWPRAGTGYEG